MKNLKNTISHSDYPLSNTIRKARLMICPVRMEITPSRQYNNQEKWCQENLKDDYILFSDALYTKTEEDAMAFKLRWV